MCVVVGLPGGVRQFELSGRREKGDTTMERYDGIGLVAESASDDECIALSVAEMIELLMAIEQNLAGDVCLMDLAPEIMALRDELAERRELAIQVAAEIDAENCAKLN